MAGKTASALRMKGATGQSYIFPPLLLPVFLKCHFYWVSNLHMKIGRNEPCPCGSGRKYKKCCLRAATPTVQDTPAYIYTDLDDLSNQVPTLIKEGKYDEAEEVCRTLLKQFPEQIDGLHRLAEVFEAKGDNLKATEYYRRTAEFAGQEEGFGKESVEYFTKKAEQLVGKKIT